MPSKWKRRVCSKSERASCVRPHAKRLARASGWVASRRVHFGVQVDDRLSRLISPSVGGISGSLPRRRFRLLESTCLSFAGQLEDPRFRGCGWLDIAKTQVQKKTSPTFQLPKQLQKNTNPQSSKFSPSLLNFSIGLLLRDHAVCKT